jgi:branched-chain amino acid transport system permease protein
MLMMDRPFASEIQFGTELGLFLVVGLVVGGVGTMWGAVPGAFVFVFLPVFVRQWTFDQDGLPPVLRQLSWPLFRVLRSAGGAAVGVFFGVALLLLMFTMPRGVVGAWRAVVRRVFVTDPDPAWLRQSHVRSTTESTDEG